jgi:hypothetical protein
MRFPLLHNIIFGQITPVIRLGRRRHLEEKDIPPTPKELYPKPTSKPFITVQTKKPVSFIIRTYFAAGFPAYLSILFPLLTVGTGSGYAYSAP